MPTVARTKFVSTRSEVARPMANAARCLQGLCAASSKPNIVAATVRLFTTGAGTKAASPAGQRLEIRHCPAATVDPSPRTAARMAPPPTGRGSIQQATGPKSNGSLKNTVAKTQLRVAPGRERLPDRLGAGLVLQPAVLLHAKQPFERHDVDPIDAGPIRQKVLPGQAGRGVHYVHRELVVDADGVELLVQRVVARELLRRAVGQLGERQHPAAGVLEGRLDQDVHVFGQPHDALECEGVPADERVFYVLAFEEVGDATHIFIRSCTRSLVHRSWS